MMPHLHHCTNDQERERLECYENDVLNVLKHMRNHFSDFLNFFSSTKCLFHVSETEVGLFSTKDMQTPLSFDPVFMDDAECAE